MTKAMILAAGRGERLRPLTDICPKPLVKLNGKPLIEYHIENLKKAGINEIVINLFHLGEQIKAYLGYGTKWDVTITYSEENTLLGTGGGIYQALPLLGDAPFILINGDIWTDFPFSRLPLHFQGAGYLILVNNPNHNQKGDFAIRADGKLFRSQEKNNTFTYSGISVLHPSLFKSCPSGSFSLVPLFDKAIHDSVLSGEYYPGIWSDIGTIDRLNELESNFTTFSKIKTVS